MKNKKSVYFIVQAAVIGALYAALTYLQNAILPMSATLAVQVRVSEALTMLCVLTPSAIPGLTVGCVLANLTSLKTMPLDIVFGSAATLISSILAYRFRNIRFRGIPFLSALMPVIFNAVIVGLEITFFVPMEKNSLITCFLTQAAFVALGEIISVMILGIPFMKAIEKRHIIKS